MRRPASLRARSSASSARAGSSTSSTTKCSTRSRPSMATTVSRPSSDESPTGAEHHVAPRAPQAIATSRRLCVRASLNDGEDAAAVSRVRALGLDPEGAAADHQAASREVAGTLR